MKQLERKGQVPNEYRSSPLSESYIPQPDVGSTSNHLHRRGPSLRQQPFEDIPLHDFHLQNDLAITTKPKKNIIKKILKPVRVALLLAICGGQVVWIKKVWWPISNTIIGHIYFSAVPSLLVALLAYEILSYKKNL